jgi:hypothetical protein
MAHQITQFLASFMGVVGVIVFFIGVIFVVMDILDVYLRIRERVMRDDFLTGEDKE